MEGIFGGVHALKLHGAIQAGRQPDLVRLPQRYLRPKRQSRLGTAASVVGRVFGSCPRRGNCGRTPRLIAALLEVEFHGTTARVARLARRALGTAGTARA